uniref:Peroxiredoxin n=1 Tax=Pyramimonas obovata TaxID=1411642 RepID=A0A7S0RJK0_9CHLO|mmetsp:Transcript_35866/g.78305  ORF Transcript_35866/g.78305 Transcript_35866/m.78305 type:complete len:234 (+) Transcript_35866:95-796(+)|eukprot:CAMPEP_0118933308 /NCGR_PEP_ID=MMETSP1169-20130426/11918_1 /TAXON_ID=36882 /ORGANISM="Pyramimonas obovata, Strain CCMP722" /LENGTH=233 /DNA_ID=CAMNT_0006876055 /DNA_START=79 /DNA_END=780 /DNA_ORIENTATION=+
MGHGLNLGDVVPDFTAFTAEESTFDWHAWIDGSWAMLCSHPADFTPVCTTELGYLAKIMPEFEKRGVKVAAISCQSSESHKEWITDIEATHFAEGSKVTFPLIEDTSRRISEAYGMLDPDEKFEGLPMACRAVFIIGPDKTLKLSILYPATTGRNFHEILRVIDSLQLTANHKVATPANWTHGGKVMVLPTLADAEAKELFSTPARPEGFVKLEVPSQKGYLRMTDDPVTKLQ